MNSVGTGYKRMHASAGSARTLDDAKLLDRLLRRGPVSGIEILGLVLLSAAFVVAAAWALRVPLLLQHDESVYALMARHWQAGTPDTGASSHRAPLLPVLGIPVLALGGGDLGLRIWGTVAGVGGIVAVWWLGRLLRGPVAGLIAAAVFALAPPVFRAGTAYLTDLPAAALLIAMTGLLWWQLALRPAPNRWLLAAAPLAWAAYELRYGSALVVVLLFVTTMVMFWPNVRAHARLCGWTIGLLVLLLVPHLVNSTLDLGTPWQRLVYTSEVAGRDYLGQGLVQYVRWFPRRLAGMPAAALMATGLLGAAVVWVRARVWSRGRAWMRSPGGYRSRGLAFLILPAVGHIVAVGIASHGESRFVFFAVALLCVAGAVIVADVLAWLADRSAPVVWVAMLIFGAVMVVHTAVVARSESRERDRDMEREEILLTASSALQAQSGANCSVLTTYNPQVTWYSGCASYHFGQPPVVDYERYLTDDGWMLLFEDGKRQPVGATLEHYLDIARPVASWDPPGQGEYGSAALYRMTETGE